MLLSGLAVLSLNMFVPSLTNMATDFRADYSLVSLSVAGYLASTAVLQVVMGPLSDRFGRRRVLLAGLAIFTLASLVCALTTMMIGGRIVACIGLLAGLVLVTTGSMNAALFFGSTIFVGIGNGLTMPSSNAGALSVRPQLAGSASGLSGALTVAGGAILTAITGAILTEANGSHALLAIMLVSSLIALLAALHVLWTDRKEARARSEMPA